MAANNTRSLITLITVFFFWGFVAASNTILIGIFKEKFDLSQAQSQLVEVAFYCAYFVGSLIYFLWSVLFGDPLNKIGYKKGLVLGLLISAVGSFGFIPAAERGSFYLMLTSLFTVGLGFALQQIVANPYVMALGTPEKGAHRVSLAGGINSFGTTIAPLLVGFAIYGTIDEETKKLIAENLQISSVRIPYTILGIAFLLVAALIGFSKLPTLQKKEQSGFSANVFKYPQLVMGMLAIFAYVGAEVTVQSNLQAYIALPEVMGLPKEQSGYFISLYWGSLMIGRWTQSVSVFNLVGLRKKVVTFFVPFLAFAVILVVNYLLKSPINDLLLYTPAVGVLSGMYLLGNEKPGRTLLIFALCAVCSIGLGMLSTGTLSVYFFVSAGLFCSIMWPCIFSLSLAGLGQYTNQGSSLLVMMILGGAVVSYSQGYLADMFSLRTSYILPLICFTYLAVYAIIVPARLRMQGIDYDAGIEKGK